MAIVQAQDRGTGVNGGTGRELVNFTVKFRVCLQCQAMLTSSFKCCPGILLANAAGTLQITLVVCSETWTYCHLPKGFFFSWHQSWWLKSRYGLCFLLMRVFTRQGLLQMQTFSFDACDHYRGFLWRQDSRFVFSLKGLSIAMQVKCKMLLRT